MDTYDCVIIGGGPAGAAAAIAAGRMGARCLLVERHDILGGMGTAALVCVFCPANYDGRRFIIGGIFGELRRDLIAAGRIYEHPGGLEAFDPDAWAELLLLRCQQAGVTVATRTAVVSASEDDGVVRLVLDDGRTVAARAVVDAGGNAAVARQLGAATVFGRHDGRVMPLTFCYLLGGIDLAAVRAAIPHGVLHDGPTGEDYVRLGDCPEINHALEEERRAGRLTIPRDHISAIYGIPGRPGVGFVNYGRVNVGDPGDPADLARAEAEGRQQIAEGIDFLRRRVPGFARVEVVQTARQIGVRESHHLRAMHVLSGAEAEACTQFPDAIAQCCYSIDIHQPGSDSTVLKTFAPGTHFDIPWRSLIPDRGSRRVVVAGRCLGADHVAASSLRVMPSMAAVGEAGGVTAALIAATRSAASAIDPGTVRARLLATGGILS
jgi:glycine/D-amino acid oxidase-like deaminating enzyme